MAASLEAQDLSLQDILSKNDLNREDLNTECHQNIMYDIAIKITEWKVAGYYLNIPKEKLEAIEDDNQKSERCRIALITTWKEYHGKGATYLMLITAFLKLGRRDLVDTLCDMIKSHIMACRIQQQSKRSG